MVNRLYYFLMIFSLFLFEDANAQFSFIFIEDDIKLTDSNAVIFKTLNQNENLIVLFESREIVLDTIIRHTMSQVSDIINLAKIKRNQQMKSYQPAAYYKQHYSFEKYGFQLYPIIDVNGKAGYFVVIILKEYFEEWQTSPLIINDGGEKFYIFGLCYDEL